MSPFSALRKQLIHYLKYRVTIQVVQNLPLTSKQKLRSKKIVHIHHPP